MVKTALSGTLIPRHRDPNIQEDKGRAAWGREAGAGFWKAVICVESGGTGAPEGSAATRCTGIHMGVFLASHLWAWLSADRVRRYTWLPNLISFCGSVEALVVNEIPRKIKF